MVISRFVNRVAMPPINCLRRLFVPSACVVAVPLALACAGNAVAASDGGGGGGGSASGGGSSASSGGNSAGSAGSTAGSGGSVRSSDTRGGSNGNTYFGDETPVVTGSGSTTESRVYAPSGGGSDNPFGFAYGFAPSGCVPTLSFGNSAGASNANVLWQPDGPAGQGQRYVRASIAGSETFSDNINLDSDANAESDFVTAVSPQLDACSSTGRIRGQATYQLQGVVYAHNSQYNDVYNNFQGSTTIGVIPGHLYLDASTDYGQTVIDPSVGYSDSNIIRPNDNKTTTWRTNLSPYIVQSLGLLGQGMVRYRYGHAYYKDDSVPDTTVNGVSASLTSPASVDPVSWQFQGVTQSVDRSSTDEGRFFDRFRQVFGSDVLPNFQDPDRTRHFDSATAQLGYRITDRVRLTALGGVEDRYKSNGENDRWSSTRWQVGARFDGARNSLEGNVGHRFYGTSYSLYAEHRARVFDLSLSYQEDPSSPGLDSLNSTASGNTFGSVGSIGAMLGGGYGGYGNANGTTSLLDRGVYVSKRWRARAGFDTALTRTTVTGFYQKRDYPTSGVPNSNYYGASIDTRYAVGRRTSIVPSASWQRQDQNFVFRSPVDGTVTQRNTKSVDYTAGISLVRAISRSAQAAIGYGRSWRTGGEGSDYKENRVTLQFRKGF